MSIDLSTIPLSATTVSSAGTVRWMSPELLFGQNSPPTRESDSYALGMVIYEVGWLQLSLCLSVHLPSDLDRSQTVSLPRSLCIGGRCAERRTSKETDQRRVPGVFRQTVGVGTTVLG